MLADMWHLATSLYILLYSFIYINILQQHYYCVVLGTTYTITRILLVKNDGCGGTELTASSPLLLRSFMPTYPCSPMLLQLHHLLVNCYTTIISTVPPSAASGSLSSLLLLACPSVCSCTTLMLHQRLLLCCVPIISTLRTSQLSVFASLLHH